MAPAAGSLAWTEEVVGGKESAWNWGRVVLWKWDGEGWLGMGWLAFRRGCWCGWDGLVGVVAESMGGLEFGGW